MSKFSNYLEDGLINATLRGTTFTAPSGTFLALFTADPTDANTTANEVQTTAWPAYVRMDCAAGGAVATGWTAPSDGVTSNAKALTFPANNGAGANTVTHIGIYDSATGGNLLYHSPLTQAKTLQVGDVISFAVGSITVTLQ